MASYATSPSRVTLEIDDTCDVAHGHQQLSLFNAHYDERCFPPIHVYDTEKSRPAAVILRPGKTPSGVEVCVNLCRLVRRIRSRWLSTPVLIGGDGHYARPEPMSWCEENDVDCVFFGLPGTKPLSKRSTRRPTPFAPGALWRTKTSCAASPRRATGPAKRSFPLSDYVGD